jgi:hypothetical protein
MTLSFTTPRRFDPAHKETLMSADSSDEPLAKRQRSVPIASGIGAGVAIGVALGVAMKNMGAGIAIGIAIGVGIGVALNRARK